MYMCVYVCVHVCLRKCVCVHAYICASGRVRTGIVQQELSICMYYVCVRAGQE